MVVVRAGARASVLLDLRKVCTHALTVMLERGAELSLRVHSGSRTSSTLVQTCTVAARARLQWQNLTEGNVQQSLAIRVTGAAGHAEVRWAAHAKKRETQELSAHVLFAAPRGSGETELRAAVEEHAITLLRGKVEVARGAKGTETHLTEQVLLLDPTAKTDAVPELSIATNEVKAGHRATISKISPEDLFYLASRGIPAREARRMYVEGFLGELSPL